MGRWLNYKVYVNRIINLTDETLIGNYSLVAEYSNDKGDVLDEITIIGDEQKKPFMNLSEIAGFINRKFHQDWPEEKKRAWTELYDRILEFLEMNGEPY